MDDLNPQQLEAVTSIDIATVVLSCPGSGKTKVVTSKVHYINKTHPGASICCTTFSKEGSEEMKERISRGFDHLPANIKVSTFHSLCYNLVRSQYGKPNMIRGYERNHLIKQVIEEFGLALKTKDLISIIDKIPTNSDSTVVEPVYIQAFNRYIELLNSSGKLDFNSLLVIAVNDLESGKMSPLPFDYLICDEAQDSDNLMLRWLRVHVANGSIPTIMLDDDQTLYSFRNSLGVEISRFAASEFDAKIIRMGTNYRSHEEILAKAGKLITHNLNREDKDLISHKGPGGSVTLHTVQHQYGIPPLLGTLIDGNFNDWFILCRTNIDLLTVSAHLVEIGLPHYLASGKGLFEQDKVANYLGLLQHIDNPTDLSSDMLLTTLGANKDAKDSIIKRYGSVSKFITLDEPIESGVAPSRLIDAVNDLRKRIDAWKELALNKRFSAICKQASRFSAKYERSDNGKTLIEMTGNILAKSLKGSIKQRLNALEKKQKEEKKNGISLLTAHASKGLEKPNVIIWNLSENSFPAKPDEDANDTEVAAHFEEERRILYVAMTRAETQLHLIFQRKREGIRSNTYFEPSQFLVNLGYNPKTILESLKSD